MTERELLREQWRQVANALSIKIVAPFRLHLPNGKEHEVACLLPQFGREKGMLIDCEYSKEAFGVAAKNGYAISTMAAEHHYLPINAESYIECLVDWGWASSEQEPSWLQMPPNNSFKSDA
jgi:hypothetical protein